MNDMKKSRWSYLEGCLSREQAMLDGVADPALVVVYWSAPEALH